MKAKDDAPAQTKQFVAAVDAAWRFNKDNEEARLSDICVAGTEHKSKAEGAEIELGDRLRDRAAAHLARAIRLFPSYPAPPELAQKEDQITDFADPEVWALMTPEQRLWAADLREGMAQQLGHLGVTEESLRVLKTDTEGKPGFSIVHTGKSVDIGDPTNPYDTKRSYNYVMSEENDSLFIVDVNGRRYDTRSGMKAALYAAKAKDDKKRGVTLPDSEPGKETDGIMTCIMLTGEPLNAEGGVRTVAELSEDGVVFEEGWVFPEDHLRFLRICPSVLIDSFTLIL